MRFLLLAEKLCRSQKALVSAGPGKYRSCYEYPGMEF